MQTQNLKVNPQWINPSDLCRYLGGISKVTLWRYYKSGKLPQPKRISKSILLWDINEVNQKLGLTSEAETAQGGENE